VEGKKKDRIGTRSVNWEDIDVSQAEQTSTPTIEAAQNPVDGHLKIVPFQAKLGTFFFLKENLLHVGWSFLVLQLLHTRERRTTPSPTAVSKFGLRYLGACWTTWHATFVLGSMAIDLPSFLPPSLTTRVQKRIFYSVLFFLRRRETRRLMDNDKA